MKYTLSQRIVLATVCFAAMDAHAQAVNVPNTARPDVLQRQLRIEDTAPTVSGAPLIMMEDDAGARQIKGDVRFKLNSVGLEESTVFGPAELEHLYKDYVGTEIALDTLNKIAADITSYYRNEGYILTRAVVPPQRIAGGNVKIRVVEGFVNEVRVEGERADDPLIRQYADKIRASKPLDVEKLERYLLLMEDLPGVEARAVLQPSPDVQGASDIVVNITRKPVEFSATLDNRGSRFLGPEQLGVTAAFNDLLSMNDQTQVRVVNSILDPNELVYGEVRHEQQLGTEGTKLVVSASHVETRPEFTLEPFDIVGKSTAFSAGVSHPILRSRRANWFVNGDFTARNVNVDSLDLDLYYDKTRVFGVGTSYDFVDSLSSVNRIEAKLHKGMAFGTQIENQFQSRANGKASFTKVTAKASRIQPISGPWSAYAAASGQYSADPLLASEEFSLGGAEFGSAYDSAEITGDSGAAARVELQYNQAPQTFVSQYQLYGFYDIGRVWNRSPIPGSENPHDSLSSTGLGLRFNVNESVSGGLEGALPLTRKVATFGEDGADPRVFFNLQYRY